MTGPLSVWCDRLRLSATGLRLQSAWKRRQRLRRASVQEDAIGGGCAVCQGPARFSTTSANPRESPACCHCGSVPRQRALVLALRQLGIPLGRCRIHESSPSLCTYEFFARECGSFMASYYLPAHPLGSRVGAFLNVDLGRQPFADGSFDLVVTLDVLEHLPEPMLALREIGRTLAPGGLHVFTVPRADYRDTQARARFVAGQVEHLREPEYHRDPIARAGSLVITDWGRDLERLVSEATALECAAMAICEPSQGIPQPIEVFVMRRPG